MIQVMEEGIVKKVICLLLLLSFFITTTVMATDGTMIGTGTTAMGFGLGIVFLPMMMSTSSEVSTGTKLGCYFGGGATIALGFALAIWGAMRGEYYTMLNNPILDIVSFSTSGRKTYVGAKFSF